MVYLSKDIYIANSTVCRVMEWLGNMSYPLYPLQVPLLWRLSSETPIRNGNVLVVLIVAIVSVTYYLGCLVTNAIESALAPIKSRSAHPM